MRPLLPYLFLNVKFFYDVGNHVSLQISFLNYFVGIDSGDVAFPPVWNLEFSLLSQEFKETRLSSYFPYKSGIGGVEMDSSFRCI